MPKLNRKDAREIRQADASDRRGTYENRSPQEQIAALDARLGKGIGAVKERARLQAQL